MILSSLTSLVCFCATIEQKDIYQAWLLSFSANHVSYLNTHYSTIARQTADFQLKGAAKRT